MSFVHLHVHSQYSLLQASSTIPDLVDKCLEYKMPAMALTDYGNMFGCLEFYFEAKKKGIRPILACEMYYVEDHTKREKLNGKNFRNPMFGAKTIVLLAKNLEAYRNLCRINMEAYQKGFYFVPRADYSILQKNKEGLIALTGAGRGRVPWIFQNKGKDEALKEINRLQTVFGKDLYLELLPCALSKSEEYNLFLAEVGREKKLSLIATNDVHYTEKKDSLVQDILFCIGTNRTLYDKDRARLGGSEFYFKNSQEMLTEFKDHSSLSDIYERACNKTLEIFEECRVNFKVKDDKGLPIYHLPKVVKAGENLKKLSKEGLEERIKQAEQNGENFTPEKRKEYIQRIDYELRIIEGMGFQGYFHIVYDFIRWAKQNSIPVGPGRGSGASSLVSYCLGITDLDPMPLNLIFERFLNPERISMPDFDIDFCQENRQRVIEYIDKKYGSECSSHVITYGRLSVRAALRDVGRVLALNYKEVDKIAKLIPDVLGITLKEALKKEPRFKELTEENPQIAELIQLTGLLKGLVRHVGIHAAGIIIADTPIIDYAPLYRGPDGENVIQYDLKSAEKIGLVKFDFLGLKTLTQIAETLRLIKKNTGTDVKVDQISLKDPKIYSIMSQGDTVGIFQFEGNKITELLVSSQPACFEDIIAINALYRPGPMNMIPSYLDRKKGRVPVEYLFPELEPILKETYGIIVYQEQVQQIAVKISGYSYGEADVLRRAMGKKIQSEMKRQKIRFLEGAKKRNYNLKKSEELFELMAEFAKYGFNKSHAAAYCVLAAQTAWLKAYYPVEFLAAQMTIEQNDSDKLVKYVRDAKLHKIPIVSPHINSSFKKFTIQEGKIYYSLAAVKGVGGLASEEIVRVRESLPGKKFSSIEEFFETIDIKQINRKALESLIKSGAFDGFAYERREILENKENFSRYSLKRIEEIGVGQQSLFGNLPEEDRIHIVKTEAWTHKEKLNYEKEVFGFYLNDYPMKCVEGLESSLVCKTITQIKKSKVALKSVEMLTMICDLKEVVTKKKDQLMAFGVFEDGTSALEVIFFPKLYMRIKNLLLQEGEVFHLIGSLQKEKRGPGFQLIAEDICLLEDLLKSIKKIQLNLHTNLSKEDLLDLKKLLAHSKGGSSLVSLGTYISKEEIYVDFDTQDVLPNIEINYDFLRKTRKILKTAESIKLERS